jgi:hypothetical protein
MGSQRPRPPDLPCYPSRLPGRSGHHRQPGREPTECTSSVEVELPPMSWAIQRLPRHLKGGNHGPHQRIYSDENELKRGPPDFELGR